MKITIHRALAELKLLDAKIDKAINEIVPLGFYQKDKNIVSNNTKLDEFGAIAKAKFESTNDLIARKSLIKSKIVEANATTDVTVAGKTMKISDAITMKSIMAFKKALAAKLTDSQRRVLAEMNKANAIVETNVQKLLEITFGKEQKSDASVVESVRKPYLEMNEFHLFDPLDLAKTIDVLNKEVSDFEMEVDSALSEINATTFIEV